MASGKLRATCRNLSGDMLPQRDVEPSCLRLSPCWHGEGSCSIVLTSESRDIRCVAPSIGRIVQDVANVHDVHLAPQSFMTGVRRRTSSPYMLCVNHRLDAICVSSASIESCGRRRVPATFRRWNSHPLLRSWWRQRALRSKRRAIASWFYVLSFTVSPCWSCGNTILFEGVTIRDELTFLR